MLAAEAAPSRRSAAASADELDRLPRAFRASWLHDELHRARNFKPWMSKGLYTGTLMVGIDQIVLGGKAPWTLRTHADHETLVNKARGEADRLSEARRRAHVRPPVLGVRLEHQPRRGPAGAPDAEGPERPDA
jgi:flavin-dependent dehydrogenase